MYKKTLGMFLMGTLFFFCSCVDDSYDLNQEISTDVEIKGNKLAMPLGSLRPILLDSIMGGIDIIDTTEDGVYCINRIDTIRIDKEVKPMLISISPKSVSKTLPIPTTYGAPAIAGASQRAATLGTKEIPFEVDKAVPFDHEEIFNQFRRIYNFTFKKDMLIELNIKINGLEALQESLVDLDFTIDFAPFFELADSDDPNVTVDKEHKNRVHIVKEYLTQSPQGVTIPLYCNKLNFKHEFPLTGLTLEELENGYTSHITAVGRILMNCNEADRDAIQQLSQMDMAINCTFAPVNVKIANGIFKDTFDAGVSSFNFNLAEQLSLLKEEGTYVTLSEPQIDFELQNFICMQTEVDVHLVGKDKNGEIIPSTEIATSFPIDKAEYDYTIGDIVPHTTKVFFTSNSDITKEGYKQKVVDELRHLLEEIPYSMSFTVHPHIDYTYAPHIIDLDHSFSFSAPYHMFIPLKFDSLRICYTNTIPLELDTKLEMFRNAGLKLKMDIASTIPCNLTLKATALDKDDNPVPDIIINPFEIAAGNGESILQEGLDKQTVELSIQSESGDFTQFNKLRLYIVTTNPATHTTVFKSNQGIALTDISIELSGDINTTLN